MGYPTKEESMTAVVQTGRVHEGDDDLLRKMRESDQSAKTAFRLQLSHHRWSRKLAEIYQVAYDNDCGVRSHVEKHWLRKEMFVWISGYTASLICVYEELAKRWPNVLK